MMYLGLVETVCGVDCYGVDVDSVNNKSVTTCLVGNVGGVEAIEHDIACNTEDTEVVVVTLEKEVTVEVVDFSHVVGV